MSENELISRTMTVARIFESDAGEVEVVFLESPMFFRLSRDNAAFDSTLSALQSALKTGYQIEVRLRSLDSDVIEIVRAIKDSKT